MPFFREMRLRVPSVAETCAFYTDKLELKVLPANEDWAGEPAHIVQFNAAESGTVIFMAGKPLTSEPASGQKKGFVWIGLANFLDVKQSVDSVAEKGVEVKLQGQFEDVAYVAHMKDNNGTTLELLQTTFEDNFKPEPVPTNILKADAVLGQAKFNVFDPEANVAFYLLLGMKLLSKQRVEKYKFTLWFLAYTDDEMPNPDPAAIENREWLWQKKYTQIELQHWDNTAGSMWLPSEGEVGFDSNVFQGTIDELAAVSERLSSKGVEINEDGAGGFVCKDPDGRRVRFVLPADESK